MQRAEIGRFKLGSILHSRTELMFFSSWHTHTQFVVCITAVALYTKGSRWRGWDSNPRTPKGRDHSSRFFLTLHVLREEIVHRHLILSPARLTRLRYPSANSSCL